MRFSKAAIALVAVLTAAMSVSALARGHGGGRGGGHGFSGAASHGSYSGGRFSGGVGHGSFGGHAFPGGVRAPVGHAGPPRHFVGGGARVGVFIGAPIYAPLFYPPPVYYYTPPPTYIEQAPTPDYWYFCPELNAYYPYVQECPGGWQPVLPQPPG